MNPHLNHALALLCRIEDVPLGAVTDHFIAMAADELEAGGRPDLAARVMQRNGADDVRRLFATRPSTRQTPP